MLQEDMPAFLQLLQEVEPCCAVLGVGVARVRARGRMMMAWITYGGPDGADALGLAGGSLFSFYNTDVLQHGDTLFKVVACLRPMMHARNMQDMFA